MTEKNLELLRPFDLESAKAGTLLCSEAAILNGEPAWKYAAGPDASGRIVAVKISDGNFAAASRPEAFRMAPLCWVEGRPVYQGDRLWHRTGERIEITAAFNGGIENDLQTKNGLCHSCNLTWAPPKVKREGFAVVSKQGMLLSREDAEKAIKDISLRGFPGELVIAHAEWEEPAA